MITLKQFFAIVQKSLSIYKEVSNNIINDKVIL